MVKVIVVTLILIYLYVSNLIPFMYLDYFIAYSSVPFNNFPILTPSPLPPFLSKSSRVLPSANLSESISQISLSTTCRPSTFGYTESEYWRNFPYKSFTPCSALQNLSEPIIKIENDTLTMSCEGWYYLGMPVQNESQGQTPFNTKPIRYSKPVRLNNVEWAFGSCIDPKTIQSAAYTLKEKPEVKSRVSSKMAEMQIQSPSHKTRPLLVINLMLDSVSRKTFYRRFPKTIQFLNELNKSKFKTYDFKLHNAVADNSLPNLFPLWTGQFLPELSKKEMYQNREKKEDLIYNISIWKELREKGWVTLLGSEFCNDYFAYKTGRNPKVDHLMAQFWCAASPLTNYSDTKWDQRCIGNKYSHEYFFDYLLQYAKSYEGLNKWAHVMCVTAHDDTGTVIETLDQHLMKFLKELANIENFVLFLMADHGMRYGEWYKSENGGQEHRLPLFLMLTNDQFIQSLKYSDDVLRHNSEKLVTKRDLNKVLRFLSLFPYGIERESGEGINLFTEKVPFERTCEHAGIPNEYCACNIFHQINSSLLLKSIVDLTIEEINKASLSSFNEKTCRKVTLKQIDSGKYTSQGFKILIKVNFTVNEIPETLESFSMIFSKFMKQKPKIESFQFVPFYLGGKRMFRLLGLKSNFKSTCERQAWDLKIIPDICICNTKNRFKYDSYS